MLLERNGKLTMWKSKSSHLSYSLIESLTSTGNDECEIKVVCQVTDKFHVSRLLTFHVSTRLSTANFRLQYVKFQIKQPKSENDKFESVSEIISFPVKFEKLSYLKRREGAWFSLCHKSELLTAMTFKFTTDFGLYYTRI